MKQKNGIAHRDIPYLFSLGHNKDEKLGPATFFITLTCAEYNWQEMRSFLSRVNEDIPNVESVTISSLTAIDPVSVCMVFENRCLNKN